MKERSRGKFLELRKEDEEREADDSSISSNTNTSTAMPMPMPMPVFNVSALTTYTYASDLYKMVASAIPARLQQPYFSMFFTRDSHTREVLPFKQFRSLSFGARALEKRKYLATRKAGKLEKLDASKAQSNSSSNSNSSNSSSDSNSDSNSSSSSEEDQIVIRKGSDEEANTTGSKRVYTSVHTSLIEILNSSMATFFNTSSSSNNNSSKSGRGDNNNNPAAADEDGHGSGNSSSSSEEDQIVIRKGSDEKANTTGSKRVYTSLIKILNSSMAAFFNTSSSNKTSSNASSSVLAQTLAHWEESGQSPYRSQVLNELHARNLLLADEAVSPVILPRGVELRLFCDPQANIPVIRSVNEDAALHYTIEAVTDRLCKHPRYTPRLKKHRIRSAGVCYPYTPRDSHTDDDSSSSFSSSSSSSSSSFSSSSSSPSSASSYSSSYSSSSSSRSFTGRMPVRRVLHLPHVSTLPRPFPYRCGADDIGLIIGFLQSTINTFFPKQTTTKARENIIRTQYSFSTPDNAVFFLYVGDDVINLEVKLPYNPFAED